VDHLGGPQDWLEAQQRAKGWRDALEAAGATGSIVGRGDWSPASGYRFGRQLLEAPDTSAVFVANDQMALGLLRLLYEHGRAVPHEMSIVGFDDIPEAEFFTPPLTTVRQDFNEMGRRGLHLLLEEIAAGERSTARATVPAALVVRSSTSRPR
jgi:DNA-binding LacI/PurR family transcriptional regulator